ncbi:GNAT family N-acetyltransferase [Parafrankia discariae]|uniref:GNAT family N-acetyltransferase n=1 Tax=Parafrankia discariae TaxID=365528 RepID=UPI0003645B63|nr:GNAT family protein [Parafrankia discariae]
MELRPLLVDRDLVIRPGRPVDVAPLRAILAEPSVARWWGEPASMAEVTTDLLGEGDTILLVLEVSGEVAGGIQYAEEGDPRYRHSSIDVYLSGRFQGRGLGTRAVGLLAHFLCRHRGHHRITIDPAAANDRAIRCYEKVGFRPVGILRGYERGPDGVFHDGLLMDLIGDDLVAGDGDVEAQRCSRSSGRSSQ